jgi:hypothetical protein
MANFQEDDSFEYDEELNHEHELSDHNSEDEETITIEVLEAPMYNLLVNIYNQESGYEFKTYLY